jgi:TonB-dependent starch-binding outer membrane protein SusC
MKFCYTNERLKKQSRVTWKMLILTFIFLNSLLVFKVSAQGSAITGVIVDEKNQPLTGVNVVVKGKTAGTITDIDGKYSINAASTDVLSFTFVGFKTEEIAVGNQTQINVTLKEEVTTLNEVVVVGYGVQRKSDLTGSVSSVKADDIKNMPVARIDEALQGKAAGVMVLQNSGSPGSDPKIRVRGYSSINGGNPLVIIDGVSGGSLSNLNPGDVESMEVLKDAASQAIYGSAGGNGVILVTTKHGKSGATQSDLDVYYGSQSPWSTNQVKVANGQEYAAITNKTAARPNYFPYDPATNTYMDHLDSTKNLTSTNWIDKIFRTAMMKNINFSTSGGGDKSTFLLSLGYNSQEGTLLKTYNDKYILRINSDHKITKKIKTGESFNISRNNRSTEGEENEYGSPLSTAIQMLPIVPVYATDSSGNFAFKSSGADGIGSNVTNPLAQIAYNTNKSKNTAAFGDVYGNLEILKGLTYESRLGFNYSSNDNTNFISTYIIGAIHDASASQSVSNNQFEERIDLNEGWQFQNFVTYDHTFLEKHNITLLAGYESGYSLANYTDPTLANLFNNSPQMQNLTTGTVTSHYGKPTETSGYSYFGRLNYNYADVLLLQGNLRRDYSSKFGPSNRAGTFPAASVGFKFSELNAIKELHIIDFGKIRLGYGVTGNSDIPPFQYESSVGIIPINSYPFGTPPTLQSGAALLTAANPELKWEQVITTNLGVDLGFLKNRLSFTFDYFVRKNKDMLLRKSVPLFAGYDVTSAGNELGDANIDSRPLVNYGTLDNRGFEISLGYKDKIGALEFDLNGNISHIITKMENIGDPLYGGNGRGVANVCVTKDGEVVSAFYGYKTNGLYQESDFTWYKDNNGKWKRVAANPIGTAIVRGTNLAGDTVTFTTINTTARPGDFKFVDANGDGVISAKDIVKIGDPNPKFTYGFNANFKFKAFDLSMFFQGSYGNQIFNLLKVNLYSTNNGGLNYSPDLVNSFIPATYNTKDANAIPTLITPASNTNTGVARADPTLSASDFFVEDGSYLRLKNIQLGFTLPATLTQKVKIAKLRVYIGAKNLLTFTKYKGFDPEVGESTLGGVPNSILEKGFDRGTYPQSKMYLVGLNLTF